MALSALAKLERRAGTAEIAEEIGAPRNYLGKLLKVLAGEGLVESQKGKGGGFRLVRDPAEIPLIEVMEPIEKVSRWSRCFLSGGKCSDRHPCAVHERWKGVRDAYLKFLEQTTVADLAERLTLKSR